MSYSLKHYWNKIFVANRYEVLVKPLGRRKDINASQNYCFPNYWRKTRVRWEQKVEAHNVADMTHIGSFGVSACFSFPWLRGEYYERRMHWNYKITVFPLSIRNWLRGSKEKASSNSASPLATQLQQLGTSKSAGSHFSNTRIIALKGNLCFQQLMPVVLRVNRINNASNIVSAKWALNELKTD